MPQTGQCTNYTGCSLAARNELFTIFDDLPFVCPECDQPLTKADFLTSKGRTIFPLAIVGGIALLTLMGAGGVYIATQRMKQPVAPGQIGTSFEQAEVAGAKGEFPFSKHRNQKAGADGIVAYTQYSPGDALDLVQAQLQLNDQQVRYRSGMPDGHMSMVYFLESGNLHIEAIKNGEAWVLTSAPLLEPMDEPIDDRVEAWDTAADAQASKARSSK